MVIELKRVKKYLVFYMTSIWWKLENKRRRNRYFCECKHLVRSRGVSRSLHGEGVTVWECVSGGLCGVVQSTGRRLSFQKRMF